MVLPQDSFGKVSMALAFLGVITHFMLIYIIPTRKDSRWVDFIIMIILIEILAFIFGMVGWHSKYAKIGFGLSVLAITACVAYFLPND